MNIPKIFDKIFDRKSFEYLGLYFEIHDVILNNVPFDDNQKCKLEKLFQYFEHNYIQKIIFFNLLILSPYITHYDQYLINTYFGIWFRDYNDGVEIISIFQDEQDISKKLYSICVVDIDSAEVELYKHIALLHIDKIKLFIEKELFCFYSEDIELEEIVSPEIFEVIIETKNNIISYDDDNITFSKIKTKSISDYIKIAKMYILHIYDSGHIPFSNKRVSEWINLEDYNCGKEIWLAVYDRLFYILQTCELDIPLNPENLEKRLKDFKKSHTALKFNFSLTSEIELDIECQTRIQTDAEHQTDAEPQLPISYYYSSKYIVLNLRTKLKLYHSIFNELSDWTANELLLIDFAYRFYSYFQNEKDETDEFANYVDNADQNIDLW